jgi:hypothetical protein
MAGERRRPGLSNVILFAGLECHMIARLNILLDNLHANLLGKGWYPF